MAKHAGLPFIPLRDDIPDEAMLGINLDLLQAFLPAVLAFGPARAFDETKSGFGEEGSDGGFPGGDIDGLRCMRFRAGDQAFSAKLEVSADAWDGAKDEESNR
jgi:hypothetical protein